MGFERLLKACFRSDNNEYGPRCSSFMARQPHRSIESADMVVPARPQQAKEAFVVAEWISTTGGGSCTGRDSAGSESIPPRLMQRLAPRSLTGRNAGKLHADSPGDSTATRSSTAAGVCTDAQRSDGTSSYRRLEDGDPGPRASVHRPSGSREAPSLPRPHTALVAAAFNAALDGVPRAGPSVVLLQNQYGINDHQRHVHQQQQHQSVSQPTLSLQPPLPPSQPPRPPQPPLGCSRPLVPERQPSRQQQQVFVADLGDLERTACGSTTATTTNITPITSPTATATITIAAGTQEGGPWPVSSEALMASSPLPPAPRAPAAAAAPPPPPLRHLRPPPTRSRTSPSATDSYSLLQVHPPGLRHVTPGTADGTSAPLLPSGPVGRQSSFAASDLHLAVSAVGSENALGPTLGPTAAAAAAVGVTDGGTGRALSAADMSCRVVTAGSSSRSLSDVPTGLDLRNTSQQLAALAAAEPYSAAASPLPFGCSFNRSGSASEAAAAAAAEAASAVERELGRIRVSRLEDLAKQLEGLRWLASGSSGQVFTGLWKGSPVAVKIVLSATPDQLRDSAREALLSRVVSHPAICQCYTVCAECISTDHLRLPVTSPSRHQQHSNTGANSSRVLGSPTLWHAFQPAGTGSCPPDSLGGGTSSRSVRATLGNVGPAAGAAAADDGGGGGLAVRLGDSPRGACLSAVISQGGVDRPTDLLPAGDEDRVVRGAVGGSRMPPNVVSSSDVNRRIGMPSRDLADGVAGAVVNVSCLEVGGSASLGPWRSDRQQHWQQHQQQHQQRCSLQSVSERSHLRLAAKRRLEARRGDRKSGAPRRLSADSSVLDAAGIGASGGGGGGVVAVSALCPVISGADEQNGGGGSSYSHALSRGSARRCPVAFPALAVAPDLNTTLSLSEILRSQPHLDDDTSQVAQSLPAVLLSIGAAPGRHCTIVVLEWCNQGTLLEAIRSRPFSPERSPDNHCGLLVLLRTALEIAQGMRYLHSLDIVHGDLKPSNVLLQSHAGHVMGTSGIWAADTRGYVAKVADFGLAQPAGHGSTGAVLGCGSEGDGDGQWGALAYMAPEVPDCGPSKKSDVYSFGCLLYHMCTGRQPFHGIRPGRLLAGLATGSLALQWPDHIYKVLRRLGEACCSPNSRERPSFDKVVDALQKTITYVARSPSPSRSSHTGHDSMGSGASAEADAAASAAAAAAAVAAANAWRMAVMRIAQPPPVGDAQAPPPLPPPQPQPQPERQ